MKGDKVVAFCDRRCNVIAPFVSAPGNHNKSPLLREALPDVMRIAGMSGHRPSRHHRQSRRRLRLPVEPEGDIQSWNDPQYQPESSWQKNHQAGSQAALRAAIFKERFNTIERVFAWEESSGDCYCDLIASVGCTTHSRPSPIR